MVNVTNTGSGKAKASNKWLYIVLFITLVFTAWTAFKGEDADKEANNQLEVKKTSADDNQTSKHKFGQSKQDQSSASKKIENSLVNSPIPWQKLKREHLDNKSSDVFKVHSWIVVPPVKKLPPAAPPKPEAPPVPFTYVGKLENSPKGTQIFLMENNKLLSVVMGEKINAQWKLDSEDVSSIRLTFIPLDLKQVLSKSARQVVPTAIEVNQ